MRFSAALAFLSLSLSFSALAAPPGAASVAVPAQAAAAPPAPAPRAGAAPTPPAGAAPSAAKPAQPIRSALQITEPGSNQKYGSPLSVDGKSYTLVGTGLRQTPQAKLYSMALYVEDTARVSFPAVYDRAGRSRAGLKAENRAQNFFTWGHFGKLAVLRYLRATPKEEIQQAFREGLADLLTPQAPPDMHKDAQTFIALFDTDLAEGQELKLISDDIGHLDVYLDGKKRAAPQNAKLCRHIWDIWLGWHPPNKEMRFSLLERLDVLAK